MTLTDEELAEALRLSREGDDLVAGMELPLPGRRVANRPDPAARPPAVDAADWQTWTDPDMGNSEDRAQLSQPPVLDIQRQPLRAAPAPQPATPVDQNDAELEAALSADGRSRAARGIERVGRNFTAALGGRQPVDSAIAPGSAEAKLVAMRAERARREAAAAAMSETKRRTDAYEAATRAAADAAPVRAETMRAQLEAAKSRGLETERANRATESLRERELSIKETEAATKAKKEARRTAGAGAGKTLPATVLEGLADLPTAVKAIDDLAVTHKRLGMGGIKGRVSGAVTDALQLRGTDAAEFNADALVAMQGVGKIMEGGKLAAGDEVKYRRMLPQPGDSDEVVESKRKNAAAFLKNLVQGRIETLRKGGYQVPDVGTQTTATGMVRVVDEQGLEFELDASDAAEAIADGLVRRVE